MDTKTKSLDALNLLKQDHRAVEKLFESYQRTTGADERYQLCQQICNDLNVHTEIEEQCFYPGVRSMAGLDDMVDDSLQEHAQVKQLCSQMQAMASGDARLDARMAELKQAVEHHVKEEEHEMFPQVRETCDQQWLLGLGHAMEQQKTHIAERMSASAEQRVREEVRQEPSPAESRARGQGSG